LRQVDSRGTLALMATEPDGLVLEHLRAIRAEVGLLREGVQELTGRVARLEAGGARIETSLADIHVQLAQHCARFDRVNTRLERRLELSEAPT
jgi:hypothetical protein